MKSTGKIIAFLLFLIILANPVAALNIKLGSLAPVGSPWDNALKEIAVEWRKISRGLINMKIYPGGIVGDEPDMLRKIRIRQLDAAGITGIGMTHIAPNVLAVQLPMLVHNDAELDYVLEKMQPVFEEEFESKGFKVIIWTMAGWAYFFAKEPIIYPEDLQKQKFFVTEGSNNDIQAWKKMGFHVVPLSVNNVLPALQSGMVDAVTTTPLAAAAMQWFGLAKNMCGLKWAPMIGSIVISTRTWERIPESMRPELLEAAYKIERSLKVEAAKVEAQAIEIMKENGLVLNPFPPEAKEEWRKVVDSGLDILIGKSFDRKTYDLVRSHLKDYRDNHAP
ncbi:MAG: C4-dicarboxylate ABC transporter substrate-binding protein [Spirochaeta sp.]|nr:C4-dicarboxylate ABC transporter substrate-binding protein [Spirochaeta sp.]